MNHSDIHHRLNALALELEQQALALLPPAQSEYNLQQLINALVQHKLTQHSVYAQLLKLDAARCQLELGLFGLCADCEEEISRELLDADITVQRCCSCQSKYDNEHRHELLRDH
ncbi:MAG: TraR/DksA C4-type zinc finger protein [Shewanella sp.]|nr:TraR/DksA C4-type zinc finger protein [Shewanella sp.]MCF1430447.1 TraR/DksA C4-type zinc finger protein [Shewanella sp.]MCF1437632.1 TraR/DksA C4-type zinc finger protein [Shewanella sp.]MCF1456214.1 TraR/DksA C4-type zinc finger protein [Shewanella sp.]